MELIEKRDAYNIIKDMIGLARSDVLMDAYNTLKNLPTVDAMPVVHGYWEIVGDNTVKCSICGEISCCKGNYCPDCGAKMDREDI